MEYLEISGTVKVNPNYPCAIRSLVSELSGLPFEGDDGYMLVTMANGELGIEGEGRINSFFRINSILDRLKTYLVNQSTIETFRDTELMTVDVFFQTVNSALVNRMTAGSSQQTANQ